MLQRIFFIIRILNGKYITCKFLLQYSNRQYDTTCENGTEINNKFWASGATIRATQY